MIKFFRGKENSADVSSTQSPSPSLASSPSSLSSTGTGPPRPIRLVYCDEKGKFRMDPEAVATLQLVKEPIGVVSVCGRARQGKSFILNQVSLFCSLFCVGYALEITFVIWWVHSKSRVFEFWPLSQDFGRCCTFLVCFYGFGL